MPEWYRTALAHREDPSACITFAEAFLAAPRSEREVVTNGWDPGLEWVLPNPWRLACVDEGPGSRIDRIRTDLLFQALAIGAVDAREAIMGFAVVHNSCRLADVSPSAVFEEVAQAVGGSAARALRDFAARSPKHQSMESFMLTAIADPGGGYEIRAKW